MFFLHKLFILTTLLSWILTCTYAQNNSSNATAAANTTVVKVLQTNPTNATTPTLITEGGKLDVKNVTHNPKGEETRNKSKVEEPRNNTKVEETRPYGREHVTEKPISIIPSTTEKLIPISENISSDNVDHKKTVPKKGVKFPDEVLKAANSTRNATSTTTTTTTTPVPTKEKPKKPLLTVGNSDEPFAPSHFVSSKSKNASNSEKEVPSIESYAKHPINNTDYIVPIVGVILSVPLVAIVLNIVYRRSKEWWHHRHYSRMDFLIDGMYNN